MARIWPCGAKTRGGGGAPPTTLILLRNQRSPEARTRPPAPRARRGHPRTCLRHLAGRLGRLPASSRRVSAPLTCSPHPPPRLRRGPRGASRVVRARWRSPATHDAPCGAGLAFHSAASRSALQSGGGSLRSVSGSRTAACLWPGPSRTQGGSRPTAKGNTKLPRQGAFPRPGVLDLVPPDRLQA